MAVYIKADKKNQMEMVSLNNLPKNAIKWAKNDPEFSYRLVRT